MIELTFLQHYSPVMVFVIAWILSFLALKMLKVPGPDWCFVVLSAMIALMFASSPQTATYIIDIIPYFAVLIIIPLLIFLALALTGKVNVFQKPVAWMGFIAALIIILVLAFSHFQPLSHMLPGTSDAHLTSEMEDFKEWIYSDNVKDSFVFIISIVLVGFFLLKKS